MVVPLLLLFLLSTSSALPRRPDSLFDEIGRLEEINNRQTRDEMDVEPPTTDSKIANLFYGRMFNLLEHNGDHDIATIAKYTNADTQILLCEQEKKSTFAELRQFMQLLYFYFSSVKRDGFSMKFDGGEKVTFQVKYKVKTIANDEIILEWHGEAFYDSTLKYFLFSTLTLKGDCSRFPDEIPEHPTEPMKAYMDRLQENLTTIVFNNGRHQQSVYQTFVDQFLIEKTKVQFCEKNGQMLAKNDFSEHLFKKYGEVETFTDISFGTEPFSDYQTDAVFTVISTWEDGTILKDRYRFRVEEARFRADGRGFKDWWSTWIFVECPINLTPRTDPEKLKKVFIDQACGSLPPMITSGPSVQSRVTFLSHIMKNEEQGFFVQICEDNYKPVYKISEFETWLTTWSEDFQDAKLEETKVNSFENFSFTCVVNQMSDYGIHDKEWKKREFEMKAFYEVDRWLIKEIKIGCSHWK